MKLVKMKHEITGQVADVHPAEVDNFRAGGFHAIQEEEKAKEVKAKPFGRRKKADD